MRDQSLAGGVGRAEQYVTVYSGMETQPFLNPPVARGEIRRQLGLKDDDVVVGTIARLFELKGHEDLIEIAPALCARFANLRFLWVGDGVLREKFESQIHRQALTDRFILTGMVPPSRIPELANAMDILVHPSRREGLARALPQGALCGCPCVTYDIDGAKEAVVDGKTGFVLPPFDKTKLAKAIAKLVEDRELGRAMGQAGKSLALERFDAQVMVEGLERVYADISGSTAGHRTRRGG
jgi:glycosyltransferase involved in cell wall biosynthesis